MMTETSSGSCAVDVSSFIRDGFVRVDGAFSRDIAEEALAILWRDTGCDQTDPRTWTQPVIRLGHYAQQPFLAAGNSERLHSAFDQLVGPDRWCRPGAMGTFPVRFPSSGDPGDAGWHIDVSFGTDNPDFMEWRANVSSRGRALLMLFLFSDVDVDDAPTRLRVGSHHDIARQLALKGDEGMTLRELASDSFAGSAGRKEELATGEAGTVYLCHPFIVHSAQAHHGANPRFMAQPPLLPREPITLQRQDGRYSPVEQAIRQAIAMV